MNESARDLLCDVSRRIAMPSGDDRKSSFSFQRVLVAVQWFNSVLLHDSFCVEDQPEISRSTCLYRVVQKTVPLFYFCDNFRKWTPILTIFSPLEQEIHAA